MLVLTRKIGERIQIGDGITVEVRRIEGSRVSLAIAAPPELPIRRDVRPAPEAPEEDRAA